MADLQPLAQALPGLSGLAGWIAGPQVRARGALDKSVANNDPATDYPGRGLARDGRRRALAIRWAIHESLRQIRRN